MSATVVHSIPAHGIIFLIDDCNAHGKSKYGNFTLHEKRIKKNNCHFLLDLALETHRVITNTRLQKKVCKLWFYVCAKNIKKQVSWLHRGQTKVKKKLLDILKLTSQILVCDSILPSWIRLSDLICTRPKKYESYQWYVLKIIQMFKVHLTTIKRILTKKAGCN